MKIRRLNESFSRFEDEGFFDWEGFEKFVNRYIKSKDDDITISTRFYRDNYSTKIQVTNGEDTRTYYLVYDKDNNVLTEYVDKSYSEEEGNWFSSEKEYADHLLDEFGYVSEYGRLKDGHPEWDSGIDNFIEIAKYARRNPADWDDFMHDFLKVFNTYNYKDDRLEWLSAEIYPSKRHGTFEAELHAYTRHPRERTMSDGEYVYDIQWDGKNNEWIALNSRYESVKQLARDIYKDLKKNGWLNSYKDDESIKRTKFNSTLKEDKNMKIRRLSEELNWYADSSPIKNSEFNTEVLLSKREYGDNGLEYNQYRRFIRDTDIDKWKAVKCDRCGKLMTGGRSNYKGRYCNSCSREITLRQIIGYDESIKMGKPNFPLKEAFEEDINTIKDVIDTIENIYSYDNKQFTQKQYYDLEDILGCLKNGSLQDAEDKLYSLVHYHNKNLKRNTYSKLDRCLDVITEINVESDEDNWWDEDENGFIDPDQVIDNLEKGVYDESVRTRKSNFTLKEEYPKRRVMKIDEIRKISPYFQQTHDMSAGILALVDVDDMGFCKDGVTRWYTFEDENGNPAIYFKY